MIYNVGDYLCVKNGSVKFEVDPYHFNAKWLIMSGFMDLGKPRVDRCSTVGLVLNNTASIHRQKNPAFLKTKNKINSCISDFK